jgi:chromosome partitioning protein
VKTILLASQKGGAGKTTAAINLAVTAAQSGNSALVIDLDQQAWATGWRDVRESPSPVVMSIVPGRLLHALDGTRSGNADLVIIDTPPRSTARRTTGIAARSL